TLWTGGPIAIFRGAALASYGNIIGTPVRADGRGFVCRGHGRSRGPRLRSLGLSGLPCDVGPDTARAFYPRVGAAALLEGKQVAVRDEAVEPCRAAVEQLTGDERLNHEGPRHGTLRDGPAGSSGRMLALHDCALHVLPRSLAIQDERGAPL